MSQGVVDLRRADERGEPPRAELPRERLRVRRPAGLDQVQAVAETTPVTLLR